MGRHNFVFLFAQVTKEPRIITDLEGNSVKAMLSICTLRGNRDFGENIDHLRFDNPVVMTGASDKISKIETLRKNDFIILKGTITTRDVNKTTTCPDCGTKNTIAGNVVYISPIFIKKNGHEDNEQESLKILKEHCEISNMCILVGTVCKQPTEYKEKKVPVVQYSLAVNRKFHLKDGNVDERVDYPIIKCYGKKALQDAKALKVNSSILVDGLIQTRTIERTTLCECGKSYKWNDSAVEIVPYSTEFLQNYKSSNELELEQEIESDKMADSILKNV